MRFTLAESVLSAVCYADVFEYPLTEDELVLWSIGRAVTPVQVKHAISALSRYRPSGQGNGRVIYLKGHGRFVGKRLTRAVSSRRKFILARKLARVFLSTPSVLLVGVTGGVASLNAESRDDIDLFFVVSDGTLWVSRFLVTALTELFSKRRRPDTTDVTDRMCLNMFLSESSLQIPQTDRDLYAAHEVLTMTPLWEREGTYRKFLSANSWAGEYLPNAWDERMNELDEEVQGWEIYEKPGNRLDRLFVRAVRFVFRKLDFFFAFFQRLYMRKRVTSEVITSGMLRFHPQDMRGLLRTELGKRLTKLNVPLDKVFYLQLK